MPAELPRGETVRRLIVIAIWLGAALGLGPLGDRLVPDEVKVKVAYQTFQMACQVGTLVLGLGAALLLLRRRRDALGLATLPTLPRLAGTIASVPIVFVVSCYVALQIALPTLLEELRTRGAGASQQNAGAFGRALTQSPLLVTLLWGALLAGVGEELFFRGVLWSTITDITKRFGPGGAPPPEGQPPSLRDRALALLLEGGIATVLCAAVFGYMHKDLPGGVGIVRFWSTTLLGFASGIVRHRTGGVIACVVLHSLYNTLVIGNGQKWFGDPRKEAPILEGVPNSMVALAVAGLVAWGVIAFVQALKERRARSAFVAD